MTTTAAHGLQSIAWLLVASPQCPPRSCSWAGSTWTMGSMARRPRAGRAVRVQRCLVFSVKARAIARSVSSCTPGYRWAVSTWTSAS